MTSDRRHFTRITFDAETTVSQNNREWKVDLIDLSLNGLLINKPVNWNINTGEEVDVHIALNEETWIDMAVKQKHVEDDHIGFQCQHIDIDSIIHLRRMVELNLGDIKLLERELAALGHQPPP